MADDDQKPDLGQLLTAASAMWRQKLREDVAARGFPFFTEARGEVLAHLPPEGLTQTALAGRMGITKQAVQQLVDQLVADGVVQRTVDAKDKRLKGLTLTELGLKARAEAERTRRSIETDMRVTLGDKRFKRLEKALRKLTAA